LPDLEKTKAALLDANKAYGHRFNDVVTFLQASGWGMRIKGDHHIFTRPGVPILMNLQPEKDGKAKAYQIRQIRRLFIRLSI
jgi:predicted RNA binding protein YcfA (HicA-like mRNA interferase family)